MTDHETYEILCALAATGQLAAPEQATFDEHCIQCSSCRRQLQDLISIGLRLQLDGATRAISAPMAAGSLERFRARAVREGIALPSNRAQSPLYALASAAVFMIVAGLICMPGWRKAPEHLTISAAEPIPIRQSLPAFVTSRKTTPRPSKAIHAHFVRHMFVPHPDIEVNEATPTAQRFPQIMTTGYFLGPGGIKPSPTGYPALSRSQISHLALFPELSDSNTTNIASAGAFNRSIDVASTGKIFDFASNIRQVHFQLQIAQ